MSATEFGAALSNSLSLSAIFILTALGLAITFGVMRVINMAHGDMLMLGAYTGFVVTDRDGLPKLVSGLANALGLNTLLGWLLGDEKFSLNTRLDTLLGWVLRDEKFSLFSQSGLHLNLYYAIPIAFVVVGLVG